MIANIYKHGKQLIAKDENDNLISGIPKRRMRDAYNLNVPLVSKVGSTGKVYWRNCEESKPVVYAEESSPKYESFEDKAHAETLNFIHSSFDLKPSSLYMPELNWKYLVRTAVRGKSILMTGPSGSGKTIAAKALIEALDRPDFYFNLGATQDPRASLIGNTHFDKEKGTYFSKSLFVEAIQTENAIILLDELSRAHPEAWNILITVLDERQRYLRLDEEANQKTIKVAKGVTFIATANVGNEYTSTRVMDRALLNRFTKFEMHVLNQEEETSLLKYLYPEVDIKTISNIAEIAHITRLESSTKDPRLSIGISTRQSIELASLIYDGFSLNEAATITIFSNYNKTGGADSERTFVKQLVQKYVTSDSDSDSDNGDLFSDEEIKSATSY